MIPWVPVDNTKVKRSVSFRGEKNDYNEACNKAY